MVDVRGREEGYTRRMEEMVVVEEKEETVGKEACGKRPCPFGVRHARDGDFHHFNGCQRLSSSHRLPCLVSASTACSCSSRRPFYRLHRLFSSCLRYPHFLRRRAEDVNIEQARIGENTQNAVSSLASIMRRSGLVAAASFRGTAAYSGSFCSKSDVGHS